MDLDASAAFLFWLNTACYAEIEGLLNLISDELRSRGSHLAFTVIARPKGMGR
jgi:hypothetical protein